MYVTIVLAWCFSYPKRELPEALFAGDCVTVADVRNVVNIVKELYPMMIEACSDATSLYEKKNTSTIVSPTSVMMSSNDNVM